MVAVHVLYALVGLCDGLIAGERHVLHRFLGLLYIGALVSQEGLQAAGTRSTDRLFLFIILLQHLIKCRLRRLHSRQQVLRRCFLRLFWRLTSGVKLEEGLAIFCARTSRHLFICRRKLHRLGQFDGLLMIRGDRRVPRMLNSLVALVECLEEISWLLFDIFQLLQHLKICERAFLALCLDNHILFGVESSLSEGAVVIVEDIGCVILQVSSQWIIHLVFEYTVILLFALLLQFEALKILHGAAPVQHRRCFLLHAPHHRALLLVIATRLGIRWAGALAGADASSGALRVFNSHGGGRLDDLGLELTLFEDVGVGSIALQQRILRVLVSTILPGMERRGCLLVQADVLLN